jgi:hypothetical protein
LFEASDGSLLPELLNEACKKTFEIRDEHNIDCTAIFQNLREEFLKKKEPHRLKTQTVHDDQ